MPSFLLLVLLPWMLLLAILMAGRPWNPLRDGQGSPPLAPSESVVLPADRTPLRLNWPLALAPALALLMAIQTWPWTAEAPGLLLCGITGLPVLWLACRHSALNSAKEEARASQEMAWIVWRRGSIQNEIMRAREHEAMDRRMRRCRSTLLLSQEDGKDTHHLFQTLERTLSDPAVDRHSAASLVGGMAAHLRNVFIERDRDDVSFGETAGHIARWARWLEELGAGTISVFGAPVPGSALHARKVPSTLFLGMAERMGISLLEQGGEDAVQWTWSVESDRVRLSTSGRPMSPWSESTAKDWDTAFMLRHGGIAHAGGSWHFELPLIPD